MFRLGCREHGVAAGSRSSLSRAPCKASEHEQRRAAPTVVASSWKRFSRRSALSAPPRLRRRATKPAAVRKDTPFSEGRKSQPASTQAACGEGQPWSTGTRVGGCGAWESTGPGHATQNPPLSGSSSEPAPLKHLHHVQRPSLERQHAAAALAAGPAGGGRRRLGARKQPLQLQLLAVARPAWQHRGRASGCFRVGGDHGRGQLGLGSAGRVCAPLRTHHTRHAPADMPWLSPAAGPPHPSILKSTRRQPYPTRSESSVITAVGGGTSQVGTEARSRARRAAAGGASGIGSRPAPAQELRPQHAPAATPPCHSGREDRCASWASAS